MMRLRDAEMDRLTDLLRDAREGSLAAAAEAELRTLMARHNPPVSGFPLPQLVDAGMILLGAEVAYRLLTGEGGVA